MAAPASFTELVDLAEHGPDTWMGESHKTVWGRVYGGQVVAQALMAAARSVETKYLPHSLHAYFIRGGTWDEPIRFEVERLRNGRSFCTRAVVARQSGGAILNLSASFQIEEDEADVEPIRFPADLPHHSELKSDNWGGFLDRRPMAPMRSRAQSWLRVTGDLGDDPVVHACAIAYASDDLPTEAAAAAHPRPVRFEEFSERFISASLDHALWFHRQARGDQWLLHDFRGRRLSGARGLASGQLWTEDQIHVTSCAQEILLRERSK